MDGWPDEQASQPTEDTPFALPAGEIPLARPVGPPRPTSVCGTDLLIGVPIAWGCDLALIAGAAVVATLVALLAGTALSSTEPEVPILPLMAGQLLSGAAAAVVAWYFVCRKYGKTLAEGFSLQPISWGKRVACAGLGAVSAVLVVLVPGDEEVGESLLADIVQMPYGLFAFSLLAVTLPPLEEMYYRGFIFPVLRNRLGGAAAVVIVASWFGVVHAFQLAPAWLTLLAVASMGLIWTILRHVSDSLWPPIITHWTYNVSLVIISTLGETID